MDQLQRYLPIGSVVLLKGGKKRVMVYGLTQRDLATNQTWDYIGCPFPEGSIGPEGLVFNHDAIESLFFMGLQDPQAVAFLDALAQTNDA